ncbi:hypothetical protein QE320_gp154 [Pseudomonas phage EM]|uniref:Uncharacterized protein n=1 Tax=Pseudomonas phage EM TaxID=2936914 RepID=A0AAE9KTY6_9CAUD|nr:hypothetical protein QE320_gp154 [Pseudomonas phage EM]UPW35900.1 hypothetical protein EM_115 [Pseudomonas phage EM]
MSYVAGNGHTYSFSYTQMRDTYNRLRDLNDEEFKAALPEVLHFACFACWVKEVPTSVVLGDWGLIHLIAHQLHGEPGEDDGPEGFEELRRQFDNLLKFE